MESLVDDQAMTVRHEVRRQFWLGLLLACRQCVAWKPLAEKMEGINRIFGVLSSSVVEVPRIVCWILQLQNGVH